MRRQGRLHGVCVWPVALWLWLWAAGVGAEDAPGDETEAEAEFGASAEVPREPTPTRVVSDDERAPLRQAMGDGFRSVESLPGTLPVFSGIPYLMVRGAAPGASYTLYDGVPVPSLFHVALGPPHVHPKLLGAQSFHPAVAPARHGRRLGATLSVDAAPPLDPASRVTGEGEVQMLDSGGLLQLPLGGGHLSVGGRVGYPNLMLNAFDTGAQLEYWNYQTRLSQPLNTHDRVTLLAMGAHDGAGTRNDPSDDVALTYHRAAVRFTHSERQIEVEGMLWAGHDASVVGQEFTAHSSYVSPSVAVSWFGASGARARIGLDMLASISTLEDTDGRMAQPFNLDPNAADLPQNLFDGGGLSLQSGPEEFVNQSPYAKLPVRSAHGAYGELVLVPTRKLEVELGLRGDLWLTGPNRDAAADPRLLLRYRPSPRWLLHGGVGLAHQAAVSPLPLPGLMDLALDGGLQRAVQSQLGTEVRLSEHTTAAASAYYNRFSDTVFLDLLLDCPGNTAPIVPGRPGTGAPVPLCDQLGLPRADGHAWGMELWLRRDLQERLAGWLGYTLGWANAIADDGTHFTPQTDVRHIVNLVLSYRFVNGFSMGGRVHARSGKMAVNRVFDAVERDLDRVEERLPGFARADLHVSYAWQSDAGRFTITLQWLNATFSREATDTNCRLVTATKLKCEVEYQPPISVPNLGFRAEL